MNDSAVRSGADPATMQVHRPPTPKLAGRICYRKSSVGLISSLWKRYT